MVFSELAGAKHVRIALRRALNGSDMRTITIIFFAARENGQEIDLGEAARQRNSEQKALLLICRGGRFGSAGTAAERAKKIIKN